MSQYQYENVKYIYYFTDELFYKRYLFWFIEGTDNSRPALQFAVKNFDFCTKLYLLSGNWLCSR
jgi:hypothetical protein